MIGDDPMHSDASICKSWNRTIKFVNNIFSSFPDDFEHKKFEDLLRRKHVRI